MQEKQIVYNNIKIGNTNLQRQKGINLDTKQFHALEENCVFFTGLCD